MTVLSSKSASLSCYRPVQGPPFSCRNHQPLRLALLSVLFELPRCRRDNGRARGDCDLRDHPPNELRRRRPRPGDTWHLDEVFLSINRQRHYLWRAAVSLPPPVRFPDIDKLGMVGERVHNDRLVDAGAKPGVAQRFSSCLRIDRISCVGFVVWAPGRHAAPILGSSSR